MAESNPEVKTKIKSEVKLELNPYPLEKVPCPLLSSGFTETYTRCVTYTIFRKFCPSFLRVKRIYDYRNSTDSRFDKCCWHVVYQQTKFVRHHLCEMKDIMFSKRPPTTSILYFDLNLNNQELTLVYKPNCECNRNPSESLLSLS